MVEGRRGGGGEEESAMKMWKSGGERLRSEMRARRAGEEGVRRGEGKGEGKKKTEKQKRPEEEEEKYPKKTD